MPGCAGRHVSRLGRLTLRGRDPAARHVHHRRTTCSSWLAPTAAAARGGCVCGCERCVLLDEQRHVSVSSAGAGGFRGAGRGQRQAQRQEVDGLVVRLARPFGVGRVPNVCVWWAVRRWRPLVLWPSLRGVWLLALSRLWARGLRVDAYRWVLVTVVGCCARRGMGCWRMELRLVGAWPALRVGRVPEICVCWPLVALRGASGGARRGGACWCAARRVQSS